MKRAIAAAALAAAACGAHAQIVQTIGNVFEVAPPLSVAPGAFESDTQIYVFAEKMGVTLEAGLAFNASLTGLYEHGYELTPGVIPAGTLVNSYLLHSDPVGWLPGGEESVLLGGAVTFAQEILGVILLDADLDASDAILAHEGVLYTQGMARGMEMDIRHDAFIISDDRKSLSVLMNTSNQIDQIRIVTAAAIPTPGAAGALVLTAAGLAARRRRTA